MRQKLYSRQRLSLEVEAMSNGRVEREKEKRVCCQRQLVDRLTFGRMSRSKAESRHEVRSLLRRTRAVVTCMGGQAEARGIAAMSLCIVSKTIGIMNS